MRRLLLVIILSFSASLKLVAQTDFAKLDSLLQQFYFTLDKAPAEEKCREFDYLISVCGDSLTQAHVAEEVFEHYKEPKLMGDEAVSVHIYDRWFANGTIKLSGEFTRINAELFANFNRSTLIGCTAPKIGIMGTDGKKHTIPAKGKSALLFFYDTACAKCKYESGKLPEVLTGCDFPFTFYAIYCGADKKEWKKFRKSFKIKNNNIRIEHYWDPEVESDYLKLYGVVSTPKIYFMEPGGSIIGRRLDDESLVELLPVASAIDKTYKKFNNAQEKKKTERNRP